ncbi:hypothetical protein ACFVH0_36100 [Streptomyces sp. NPDC127117]|uniref:hypothetical protein n=1 Tax=Streptomyces sp. NPDC127117 TaxID=3345368 RepID=UPI003627CAFE
MTQCLLCEQPDDTGSYLCPGCTKATIVRLECLPALYDGLAAFLAPAASTGHERSSKPAHAPLPVAGAVLDLRGPGGMVGVVEDWLSSVHDARRMQQPAPGGSVEARLKAAVNGLLANMPWISVSWPQAGTFAEEIRELTKSVRSIFSPSAPTERGTRVGRCPAEFANGLICGAELRLKPGERVVTCEWCGCTYPPATWVGLKLLIDHDERTAQDAA